MRFILICLCLITFSARDAAAANSVTLFRDGTLFKQDAAAVKGVITSPLPAGLLEQTLTVIPSPGTTILGVETYRSETGTGSDAGLEALTEQRRRLEDRLQALETREAIFTAAAKAQSGKAPRKTKTNPDPMLTIRQGTDFAIAQLEAVYTARRVATQEIRKVDARLATARKGNRPTARSLRVTVTPAKGTVTIRYATAERGWLPQYALYLAGDGFAQLRFSARIGEDLRGGSLLRVSSATLAENATATTVPTQSGSAILASYRVPVTEERSIEGIYHRFSGVLTNSTAQYLPPGETGLFRNGAYIGAFRFEGLSSGRSRAISLGK
jgi:hypothetical protein